MEPVTCNGACTVTLSIESAPLTEEKVADYNAIFWGFMLALVIVWGLKRILNLFTSDND
jgi:hypothetical protein